jgi:hypothetical protein
VSGIIGWLELDGCDVMEEREKEKGDLCVM